MKIRMIAVAVAALLLAVWLLAPRLHRFAYWVGRKDRAAVQALAHEGWQLDVLSTDDGAELVGLVRPPRADDAPWILFLPGNTTDITAAFQPVLDAVVGARDRGAAFWPWRGFDASSGVPTPPGLLADARAGWRHLTLDLRVPPARIELWGYSLGSGLAVQLAAELCRHGTPPRQLVLLSAYDRIPVMRSGAFGRLLPDDVYDAAAVAAAVTCATVLVHGSDDDALPIDGARTLQRALGGAARWIELPGRGHVDYLSELATLGL